MIDEKSIQPFIMPTGIMPVDTLKEVAGDFAKLAAFNINLLDGYPGDDMDDGMAVAALIFKYKKAGNAFKQAFQQLRQLSTEQTQEVLSYMVEMFDLDDDEKEVVIENIAILPLMTMTETLETIHLIKAIIAILKQPANNFIDKIKKLLTLNKVITKQSKDVAALVKYYKVAIQTIRK